MLDHVDITNILFFDIETVPVVPSFQGLDEPFRDLWTKKAKSIARRYDDDTFGEEDAAHEYEKAGIYAEFGKIICISVGLVSRDKTTNELSVRLKSFAHDDEAVLLREFCDLLEKRYDPMKHYLCGHNIKEFDVPYICRRLLINQMALPKMLDISGKKPWEIRQLLDTMEMWKFGDLKAFTALKLLAAVFGFPSPKDDIDGSEVARVYWQEKDLPRISRYCEKDVLAVIQLFLKYKRQPIVAEGNITHV